eukprot:scaffold1154_cov310-Pinguiococcus_pyrenoidosus.AAC.43
MSSLRSKCSDWSNRQRTPEFRVFACAISCGLSRTARISGRSRASYAVSLERGKPMMFCSAHPRVRETNRSVSTPFTVLVQLSYYQIDPQRPVGRRPREKPRSSESPAGSTRSLRQLCPQSEPLKRSAREAVRRSRSMVEEHRPV